MALQYKKGVRLQYSTKSTKNHTIPNKRTGRTHADRAAKTCTICRDMRVHRY